jgi:hypothetical protein
MMHGTVETWQRPDAFPDLRNYNDGPIAIDSETDDPRLGAGLGSGWATGETCVVGASIAYRTESTLHSSYFPLAHPASDNFDPQQFRRWLLDHIAAGVRFVGHNIVYDFGGFRCAFSVDMPPADRLEDTSALAAMVDENRRVCRHGR